MFCKIMPYKCVQIRTFKEVIVYFFSIGSEYKSTNRQDEKGLDLNEAYTKIEWITSQLNSLEKGRLFIIYSIVIR